MERHCKRRVAAPRVRAIQRSRHDGSEHRVSAECFDAPVRSPRSACPFQPAHSLAAAGACNSGCLDGFGARAVATRGRLTNKGFLSRESASRDKNPWLNKITRSSVLVFNGLSALVCDTARWILGMLLPGVRLRLGAHRRLDPPGSTRLILPSTWIR